MKRDALRNFFGGLWNRLDRWFSEGNFPTVSLTIGKLLVVSSVVIVMLTQARSFYAGLACAVLGTVFLWMGIDSRAARARRQMLLDLARIEAAMRSGRGIVVVVVYEEETTDT